MVVKKYKLFNKKFFVKTVTWKFIDAIITFTLCYILTGELFISVNLAALEVIVEGLFYYFHEHAWARTDWGEYKMDKNEEIEEVKTLQIHWQDSEKPELVSAVNKAFVDKETKLKEWLVNYVGQKHSPEDEKVTVNMIVETVAEEFPEFLLSIAEENWVRGYQQALDDSEVGRQITEQENEK